MQRGPETLGSPLMARLRASAAQLGPSERRVAHAVITRPQEVVEWSTAELAQAADTSAATVIRACQSLGFRGFQHLRLEIARAVPESRAVADDSLSRVFDAAIDALRLGRESVDADTVERAAAALAGAGRILLVGSGFSSPPLQDAALRFSTLGRSVEAPLDVIGQQFACRSLAVGDVCLALSYSGANTHTLTAARAASESGATVIAITSFARSPLTRQAAIVLSTGAVTSSHDVDPFLSRLNHLVVLHLLHDALAHRPHPADAADMRHVVADALADD